MTILLLLVRWRTGEDVRAKGSGNIGATNVLRSSGRMLGIATLLLDIAKGWVAVWLMARFGSGEALWTSLAGIVVILGHAFPAVLKFQGGKAVASFVGAFLYLAPLPLLAITIVFVMVVAATRFISSMCAAIRAWTSVVGVSRKHRDMICAYCSKSFV